MAVLKCKMCGGELVLIEGSFVAECEYCGSKQTVPSVDNEKKITLYSRANRLRYNCEFDKAAMVYESIITEFPEEAEAYWGLILCKYGIEYVDDPVTGKKIPTCHRSSFDSVIDENNYELVLENADAIAKKLYREEARTIDELRKRIIEVSSKEAPYDIFICYKETDENGNRTLDSVLAQDIYDALIEKKYRVFFARISLEEKLGQEYEPYIFAALNSAKIMLAVGTDYEHYDSIWVKNEWSRYLKLVANDSQKHLIPCYKGIDAYDMPKEFAKLQAQDLGKVGAMQDLLRGIDKLISPAKQEKVITVGSLNIIEDTLEKAYAFLNEEDWQSARKCLETVLGHDPQNVPALIGCLMHKLNVAQEEKLAKCNVVLEKEEDYLKAIKYADDKSKARLEEYNRSAKYNYAMAQSKLPGGNALNEAIKNLESISGWGDADEQLQILQQKQKQAKKQRNKVFSTVAAVVALVVGIMLFMSFKENYLEPLDTYKDAVAQMEQNNYMEAVELFVQVEDFKDSQDKISECKYLYAQKLLDSGDFEGAKKAFEELKDYMDSDDKAKEAVYLSAIKLLEAEQYEFALELFESLGNYEDSVEQSLQISNEITYREGVSLFEKENFTLALEKFKAIEDYKDAKQYANMTKYNMGDIAYEQNNYKNALNIFLDLKIAGYSEGAARLTVIEKEIYNKAKSEYDATNWGTAKQLFSELKVTGYSDCASMADKCADNIISERSRYNGIWREADNFWTDLKIDDNGVYYASSEAEQQRGDWSKVSSFSYDEDSGVLSFEYWEESTYDVNVSGNRLTLKWTNPIDQWDTDWFGDNNVFYRE